MKTYSLEYAYQGNTKITVSDELGDKKYCRILDDYNVEGYCKCLEDFGYTKGRERNRGEEERESSEA